MERISSLLLIVFLWFYMVKTGHTSLVSGLPEGPPGFGSTASFLRSKRGFSDPPSYGWRTGTQAPGATGIASCLPCRDECHVNTAQCMCELDTECAIRHGLPLYGRSTTSTFKPTTTTTEELFPTSTWRAHMPCPKICQIRNYRGDCEDDLYCKLEKDYDEETSTTSVMFHTVRTYDSRISSQSTPPLPPMRTSTHHTMTETSRTLYEPPSTEPASMPGRTLPRHQRPNEDSNSSKHLDRPLNWLVAIQVLMLLLTMSLLY